MVDLFSLAGGEEILPQKAEEPKKEEKVKFSKTKKGQGNNFNYSNSSCNDCCGRCVCDFLCK